MKAITLYSNDTWIMDEIQAFFLYSAIRKSDVDYRHFG